jgi:RHS repeat-associated protein
MTGTAVGETRTYNALGQLKSLVGLSGVSLEYTYSSTNNNGQMTGQVDVASGETITYAYDLLKRLTSASSSQGWDQGFSYDGFGNLTAKSAISGAPPVGTYAVSAATNQLTGYSYDGNGNQTTSNANGVYATLAYDVTNRMVASTSSTLDGSYEYDPKNHRVYQLQQSYSGSSWTTTGQYYYFYGLSGKKIGSYTATVSGFGSSAAITWSLYTTQVFFKGRLIKDPNGVEQSDVRGSVGKYYPYGENRGTPPPDSVQFATYTGDSMTGLNYAVNRYYMPGSGRFLRPDPKRKSAHRSDPSTWNRYSYVQGDPISLMDSTGLDDDCPGTESVNRRRGHRSADESDCGDDDGGGGDGGGGTTCDDNGNNCYDSVTVTAEGDAEAADELLTSTSFSAQCANFILQTLGIEIQEVQGKAAQASLQDGSESSLPVGAAMFPNDPTLAANQQAKADAQSGHAGTTVSQWMALNPNVQAFGQYGGNTIFYSEPFFAYAGDGYLMYTELHETLHLLGLSDAYIQNAFQIASGAGVASTNITTKLIAECGN